MSRFTAGLLASAFLIPSAALAQDNNADEDLIIVTGSPLERSIDEAITGQSILTGDELQDRLAATIGETLRLEPGVASTSFGAGASRPIIRGQGGDRVRVLTNGVGSIDASSNSPDHAVAIEPAQAERIEVVRGASILRYGSSGSGGIVNVIDGRIPSELPDGASDVAVRVGASSVDQGSEAAISLDQRAGNFVLHLDGTFRQAGDYRIPTEAESRAQILDEGEEIPDDFEEGRSLDNSFVDTYSLTGGVSYIGERGFFGVAVHHFDSLYGIPGGHEHGEEEDHDHDDDHDDHDDDHDDHDDDHDHEHGEEEEEDVSIDLKQTRIDFNGGWDFDGAIERVQIFGGYADYEHTELEGAEIGTVFANEGFEVRAEAIQAERGTWRAAHGVQFRQRDFSAIGEEAFVPPTLTQQFGVYSFHEVELGAGHLEGAVRYERTEQEDTLADDTRSFDLFSASVGGDIHLSNAVRVGGTVFRTERAPTTEELFSNGPHLATSQFELGDATLDKETATGIEGSIRHRENGHSITLNAFYTNYDGFIFEAETGEFEDGLPVFQFTAEDTEFYGFEAAGRSEIATVGKFDLSADALVEYVRATTDSGNLPRIPPLSTLVGMEAESDRFTLRGEWEYVAEANDLAAFELPTDEFNLFNAFLTWKAPIESQDVALRFSVQNIFDAEARQHTSFLKDLVPLPGRNFRFSITAKL